MGRTSVRAWGRRSWPSTLWVERVAHEPFCVGLAEHHRVAGSSRLAARELSNETLVWIPRHAHPLFYDQIVNYMLTLKFNPKRFLEAHTITQALDFAAHGAGIALIPYSASRFQRPGVAFKPLTDDLIRFETACSCAHGLARFIIVIQKIRQLRMQSTAIRLMIRSAVRSLDSSALQPDFSIL